MGTVIWYNEKEFSEPVKLGSGADFNSKFVKKALKLLKKKNRKLKKRS